MERVICNYRLSGGVMRGSWMLVRGFRTGAGDKVIGGAWNGHSERDGMRTKTRKDQGWDGGNRKEWGVSLENEEEKSMRHRRMLTLLYHSPRDRAGLFLFQDLMKERSSLENIKKIQELINILVRNPDCILTSLVPIYLLERILYRHIDVFDGTIELLFKKMNVFLLRDFDHRDYQKKLAQNFRILARIKDSRSGLCGIDIGESIDMHSEKILATIRSPLLAEQAEIAHKVSVLSNDPRRHSPLISSLAAHLIPHIRYMDSTDMYSIVSCLHEMSVRNRGWSEEAISLITECVCGLGEKLRTAESLARADERFEIAATKRLLREMRFLPAVVGEGVQASYKRSLSRVYPRYYREMYDTIIDEGDVMEGLDVSDGWLDSSTATCGVGFYKKVDPVIRMVMWRKRRLGKSTFVRNEDQVREVLGLIEARNAMDIIVMGESVDLGGLEAGLKSEAAKGKGMVDITRIIGENGG